MRRIILPSFAVIIVFFGLFAAFKALQPSFSGTVSIENIKVVRADMHPFLIDHKKMVVVEVDGRRIHEAPGYADPGVGCNSHLFDEMRRYILIECNGTWFQITKEGGKLEKIGWEWMRELPENYVGTFERQRGNI